MKRREFLISSAGASVSFLGAGNLVRAASSGGGERGKGGLHLKYAPRLGFLADHLSISQRLEKFSQHGFFAIEYNGLMRHPRAEVGQVRKKLDSLGMEMGIFVANPNGWKTAGLCDPAERANFLSDLRQAVEYHRIIENHFCTVITGPEKPGIPRSQQKQNVIDGLKAAAEVLEPTELTIVVEPLNVLVNHAGYFLVYSEEAAEIMEAVGSSRVKILFDIYHQQISEGNLINNIKKHLPYIGYFQVGDVPGRKEPGTGEVNWKNVFKAIYDTGYRGILGMEHGLSVPGEKGLLKCFAEYRRADNW